MTDSFYAKTNKIHKLVYVENGVHILKCGSVSQNGGIYDEISDEFSKCEVCFYDEFH